MKFEHFTQIIYSLSQLAAIITCIVELKRDSKKIVYLIFFLLSFSFIQSVILIFIRNPQFIHYNIAAYLLVEYYIQATIIEKLLSNSEVKIISRIIKSSYISIISIIIIYYFEFYQNHLWISYLPIFFIILMGTFAIKETIRKRDIILLDSFDFWIVYSFVFIQLCSFPIEIINFLFLGDNILDSEFLKFEAHNLTYLFYHLILIYALKWTREK